MKTSAIAVVGSNAASIAITLLVMRSCHRSEPTTPQGGTSQAARPDEAGARAGSGGTGPERALARDRTDAVRTQKELDRCYRDLAAKATIQERYEAGAPSPETTERVTAEMRSLSFHGSKFDGVECRDRVCVAKVTNPADADETSDDYWLRQFQSRRGDLFTQMGVRTRMVSTDASVTELIFELPDRETALPILSSILVEVEDAVMRTPATCPQGRATIALRATGGAIAAEVLGTECVRSYVDEAVRRADASGKADAVLSQTLRW